MSRTGNVDTLKTSTRMLLIFGAFAGPLFTLIWFVTGSMRASYDPMRHPISALSIGDFGWTQIASFLFTGFLTLVLALGLQRLQQVRDVPGWMPVLVALVGIGFLGTGFFVTDPINGYPPGTPLIVVPPTLSGFLHVVFASFVFALPVACFVFAQLFARQGERHWAVYSRITVVAFISIYLIAMAGFLQVDGLPAYAGFFQRVSMMIGLTWMTLLPIYLLKSTSVIRETGRL